MIINGKEIQKNILEHIKREVGELSFVPLFVDIVVGDDEVSNLYVRKKEETAREAGFGVVDGRMPFDTTTEEVIEKIREFANMENMCGIIVQLPLPPHIDRDKVTDSIPRGLDVDCLSSSNREDFYTGKSDFSYPTVLAVMKVLESTGADFSNSQFAIVGRGELVGKPLEYVFQSKGYKVETYGRETTSLGAALIDKDVVVSAAGSPLIIKGDMIKAGAVVVDVGTSESYGSVVGDVDTDSVSPKAAYLSKTPGGVGPVTIACLFENVLKVAKQK